MENKLVEIMEKYQNGGLVDPKDTVLLDRLASVGYVKYGISPKQNRLTARITDRGRRELKREKIYKSTPRRILYKAFSYLGF